MDYNNPNKDMVYLRLDKEVTGRSLSVLLPHTARGPQTQSGGLDVMELRLFLNTLEPLLIAPIARVDRVVNFNDIAEGIA